MMLRGAEKFADWEMAASNHTRLVYNAPHSSNVLNVYDVAIERCVERKSKT